MKQVIVSVSMITYNHEKYIKKAIEGVLMQKTNFDFEILIHDDASTDGTTDIIKEYEKKYPEIIKPIYQTENQWSKGIRGMMARYNFPRAQGKYIAICEGDDYWTDPYKLQKQVDFMEEHPEVSLCFHDRNILTLDGKIVEERFGESIKIIQPNKVLKTFVPTLTVLFVNKMEPYIKKKCIKKIFNGDTAIKMYLSTIGKVAYLPFTGAVYRVHNNGVYSGLNLKKQLIHGLKSRIRLFYCIKGINKKPLIYSIIKYLLLLLKVSLIPKK